MCLLSIRDILRRDGGASNINNTINQSMLNADALRMNAKNDIALCALHAGKRDRCACVCLGRTQEEKQQQTHMHRAYFCVGVSVKEGQTAYIKEYNEIFVHVNDIRQ